MTAPAEDPRGGERDEVDAEAARLWGDRHNHPAGGFWYVTCPACTTSPAEAFRLGFRAALDGAT